MKLTAVIAAALVLALPAAAANVRNGEHLYGRYCVSCHGPNGAGASGQSVGGSAARNQTVFTGEGPSLHGVGALSADFYLTTGYMPLKRTGIQPRRSRVLLSPAQISDLTAYVASLGGGPKIPHPHPEGGNLSEGMHLFRAHCAGCHQIVARGGYVTHAVPPGLGQATPTQIAEAVRVGPYVMPEFSQQSISDKQLDSIVKYVLYARQPQDLGGWSLGDIGPIPEGLVTWFLGATVLVAMCIVLGRRLRS
jgi:quinol---cytochrome-c reductase cytochrome c subunit